MLPGTAGTRPGGHLMGQHHLDPQPVSLCFLLIPPLCWLCQALGLLYTALFVSWLSAAVAEMSFGTWVHPQDPCLPQQAQSIYLLPALHISLALGFAEWASWLAVPVEPVPCVGHLEHGPSSQVPCVTGIWILRS